MHPAYFDIRFRVTNDIADWPSEFAIVSAYATTGETWSPERNRLADRSLRRRLQGCSNWHERVVGFAPETDHAEPSWACTVGLDDACDIGLEFLQDAIFYVRSGLLYVSFCDERRSVELVGPLAARVDLITIVDGEY